MAAEKIKNFEGLISAPFTPFGPDGNVNYPVIDKYAQHLFETEVKGVFVNGTTGEGLSLTVDERKQIIERWIEAGRNKLDIIITQIGAHSIKDAQELASHAESVGATGIAVVPPNYYKPTCNDDLISYMADIAKFAPSTPLFYYHIPMITGVNIQLSKLLKEGKKRIPTLAGAKYSNLDFGDLTSCHNADNGAFKIFYGMEEVYLAAMSLGINAGIGASFNFLAPTMHRMVAAYKKGDMSKAQTEQYRVKQALEAIVKHGPMFAALKAAGNILCPVNFGQPRLPINAISADEIDKMRADFKQIGIYDWNR